MTCSSSWWIRSCIIFLLFTIPSLRSEMPYFRSEVCSCSSFFKFSNFSSAFFISCWNTLSYCCSVCVILSNKVDESSMSQFFFSLSLLIWQSPYSPDFNPIEKVFGLIKSRMKSHEFSTDTLCGIIEKVIESLTVNEIRPFFSHCSRLWKDELYK